MKPWVKILGPWRRLVVPVVSEGGEQKKGRYMTATSTRPKAKKAKLPRAKNQREKFILSLSGEPTDLPRAFPADIPDRKVVLDASGPTATELDKEEQREEDPSEILVIPMGLDNGMSKLYGRPKRLRLKQRNSWRRKEEER
ncbi:hypothetical protein Dimus_036040, partial [Dionaea muscipula]